MDIETLIRNEISGREECKTCPLFGKTVVILEKLYTNERSCGVLFFGINPGKQEAKLNRPFIGPSGKILREKINEVGLDKYNVAFTNAILCSTPNEKDIPDVVDCINRCKPLVRKISNFLRPGLFVPVGRNCAEFLFGITGSITKLSGRAFGKCMNIIPIIHPASLIYNRNGSNAEIFIQSLKNITLRYFQ